VIETNETNFLTKIPIVKQCVIVYNHVTKVPRRWGVLENSRVFNFAIFLNSQKSRKFHL